MNLLHRISHLFGWNRGEIITQWWRGEIWVGYRCNICGQVDGAHPAPRHIYR